jgi:hypothetical protein
MTAIKTFLVCAFITALTLCVASVFAASPLLYNLGAVIAVSTAVTAMTDRILNYLNPKEEDQ